MSKLIKYAPLMIGAWIEFLLVGVPFWSLYASRGSVNNAFAAMFETSDSAWLFALVVFLAGLIVPVAALTLHSVLGGASVPEHVYDRPTMMQLDRDTPARSCSKFTYKTREETTTKEGGQ
jgi:hypothetical protein